MTHPQVGSDSLSSPLAEAGPAFGCTLGDGGRGTAWVRVTGKLDRATAPQLAQMLGQVMRRARIVVVDIRGLTHVDNSGVGAIVDASRGARRDGRRLVLVRGLRQVEQLLALVGALDAVEIVDLPTDAPPILALLQIASRDRADSRQRARAPRRIATLLGANQITRGVDALIARGTQHNFIDG
jgi:anti-sigma B factor antagonist